jgi:hypothetical protein
MTILQIMINIDNLYKVSEIKNQFDKLQKKYRYLPKIDSYLVYDLLLFTYHAIIISLIHNEIQAINKDLLKHTLVWVHSWSAIRMKDRKNDKIWICNQSMIWMS